ncbi:TetR family transcriptional regulator [Streptomyces albus subsp. albus]|nr:TetR family transcriptional regulator [Streptomyces albus subsp. albus]
MAGTVRRPTGRYAGRSAQERRAERRQRLLDAGLRLFGDSPGYRATSVTALCEAAGLSTRQFYEEFGSREEVLAALHLHVNDHAERAALEALAGARGLPLEQRAAAVFRAYASAATSDPRHIRIAFVEVIGVSPRLERQRLVRRARWVDLLCAQAAEAVERGEAGGAMEVPPGGISRTTSGGGVQGGVPSRAVREDGRAAPRDFRLSATAFIGAVNGLLHDWTAGQVDATLDEIVDELVRLLAGLVRPPGA